MGKYSNSIFTPTFYGGIPHCSNYSCQQFSSDNTTVGKSECLLNKRNVVIHGEPLCQPALEIIQEAFEETKKSDKMLKKEVILLELKKKQIELEIVEIESGKPAFHHLGGSEEALKRLKEDIAKIDAELETFKK